MIYDSKAWIADKSSSFASENVLEVLRIVPVRPLFMATLYANYLAGGMEPYYFRLANATILAAAGLALTVLMVLVLNIPSVLPETSGRAKRWIALFLGFVFVLHPLQTYVVLYVWQREAIMACFFYFSAMAAYMSARSGNCTRQVLMYALTGTLFLAGLLSKENLATFPVILVMAEAILFRQNLRQFVRRTLVVAGITLPVLLVYAAGTAILHSTGSVHPPGILHRLHAHYSDSGLTVFEVTLSECRVFFSYLRTLVVPFLGGTQLIKAETISRSLMQPSSTLPAVAGLAAVLGVGLSLCSKKPLVAFGIFFFFITLTPESLLIPQFLFFGYRPILPMAGLLLIVAQILASSIDWSRKLLSPRLLALAAAVAAVVTVGCFAATTLSQARQWSPRQFWEAAYLQLPPFSSEVEANPYVAVLLGHGRQLIDSGQYAQSLEPLARAIRVGCGSEGSGQRLATSPALRGQHRSEDFVVSSSPCPGMKEDFYAAYLDYGTALAGLGKPAEAEEFYRAAISLNPASADVYNSLGDVRLRLGATDDAIQLFRTAIRLQPDHAGAANNLGNALLASGKVPEAVEYYRKGIAVRPDSPELHNNLGAALMRMKQVGQAREEFAKAVAANPGFAKARVNLGLASLVLQDIRTAKENLDQAISLDPNLALAYVYRGQVQEVFGNPAAASADYGKALELVPDLVDARYRLARTLVGTNRVQSALAEYEKVLQLKPEHYLAHSDLGSLFLNLAEYNKAVEHLRRALAINPELPEARKNLDRAIEKLNQPERHP